MYALQVCGSCLLHVLNPVSSSHSTFQIGRLQSSTLTAQGISAELTLSVFLGGMTMSGTVLPYNLILQQCVGTVVLFADGDSKLLTLTQPQLSAANASVLWLNICV